MVAFENPSYNTMDRQYHETIEVDPVSSHANIEEPIIPISELGQTIPEHDPAGKFKNVIQVAQAAIRRGAGKMQLMMQTPPESAIGGRAKAYGPEVREQLREVFKANEAMLSGIEMPTAINNLSGYDSQRGTFDDEKMKRDMDEVKDAIKFAADVGEGGGVDIVSWEYARPLFDAPWNKDKEGKPIFEDPGEPIVNVVDTRVGRIQGIRISEAEQVPIAVDKDTGKPYEYNPEDGKFYKAGTKFAQEADLEPWQWKDYQKWAKAEDMAPEQYFMRQQLQTQIKQAKGWAASYRRNAQHSMEQMNKIDRQLKSKIEMEIDPATGEPVIDPRTGRPRTKPMTPETRENLTNLKKIEEDKYHQEKDTVESYEQQAAENQKKIEAYKPLGKYAMERTVDSYAKLGIAARQETNYNKRAKRPVSVGPELGWPHAYGSHPAEFKELIEKSRQQMIKLMTSEKIQDPKDPRKWVDNPYYEKGMSRGAAEEAAKQHIKGCFDTSHMGMWLQHFKPHLPWDKRVNEFNKWYMDEVKKLAKTDTVGSIQLVDSMSGAHGHLPPGQGIFPVVDAAKEFKKQGFKGFMVSEGHEEERFNEGRILVETWKAFNAPFESKYGPGVPGRGFANVESAYVGRVRSPTQMFGSYVPPFGEYKPWAEIPFE